ncbi:MAG: hypothetical protein HRU25_14155 [Psychrobium sp.]|nr:hypothetical protein [Psychrobium sp.]
MSISDKQQLLLDIADNGDGIAAHVKEHIFVPFFTTKQQGSGIGLNLSRQIMLQHGGDISCIEQTQPDTCFRLSFA